MSIGSSGRIVIEIDPALKKALYIALMQDGLTLKDWFIRSAENYLTNTKQGTLVFDEDEHQVKKTSNETN